MAKTPCLVVLALGVSAQVGFAIDPGCSSYGIGYDDQNVKASSLMLDAADCQASCASNVLCSVFTFYNNSKECWLQGNDVKQISEKDAISGPAVCPGSAVKSAADINQQIAMDAAEINQQIAMDVANSTKNASEPEPCDPTDYPPSQVPVWTWVLGGLSVAGAAAGAAAYFSVSAAAKKKRASRGVKMEPVTDAEAEVPLKAMGMGQLPQLAPVPAFASPVATYAAATYAAPSMTYTPTGSYAAPQAQYQYAQAPAQYAQDPQQVYYYNQGQPMQYEAVQGEPQQVFYEPQQPFYEPQQAVS
ncbi:unnamed protein product [Polarella glacialis]|uniref:Apple domain-containing protein n=1 Tax=Polarella glacialis TaxID=89957 RepID=A0A813JDB4_POLGL|nr:unnamed protein product [Polarella glacialis]